MKKKRNGFMLAELIITSTVVITAMVGLYASFNKIYNTYKEKNNYYNIDGFYATKTMINYLMEEKIFYEIPMYLKQEHIVPLICSNEQVEPTPEEEAISNIQINCENNNSKIKEYADVIKDFYHVKNMIFAEYDKKVLLEEINPQNESFKDYIKYVVNYYNLTDEKTEYNYIVLTEIEENEKTYYANLRIR